MLDIVSDDPDVEPVVLDESAEPYEETAAVDKSLESADSKDEAADIECAGLVPEVTSPGAAGTAESTTAPANHCEQGCAPEPEIALEPDSSTVPVVSQPQTPAVSYEIAEYAVGIVDEIGRFEERVAPRTEADQWLNAWKWRHLESARRLGAEPRVWV